MPIWKGKKRENLAPKSQLCPNCLTPSLCYKSGFSGIYAPANYECIQCGYKGRVYVDVDGRDDKETLELQLLREEFPELLEENKTASELATLCLEDKWHPDQANNTNVLRAWCPFCADVQVICSICKCSPDICAKHATQGLIGQLNELYDDETKLCDVNPEIYQQIVARFQDLSQQ